MTASRCQAQPITANRVAGMPRESDSHGAGIATRTTRRAQADLDAGRLADAAGTLRLVVPMPDWDDYLSLALDEIRMYGADSLQVLRRLRALLLGLAEMLGDAPRAASVGRYLRHLDAIIERSPFDAEDRQSARQEDAQGLGLTRGRGGA